MVLKYTYPFFQSKSTVTDKNISDRLCSYYTTPADVVDLLNF